MVTAKAVGRRVGEAFFGVVVGAIAVVPVAIGSVGLAISPHTSRFRRVHTEIGEDLTQLELISRTPAHAKHAYFLRQVNKYLRPNEQPTDTLQMDLATLRDFFVNPVNNNRWSISGMESPCAHGFCLFMAFGHARINGLFEGADEVIRIAPKAFCLPNTILSGIMLHEATHFVLRTDDIAYDTTTWPGHEGLKELAVGEHYNNADNWRIFYQKMRKHLRP